MNYTPDPDRRWLVIDGETSADREHSIQQPIEDGGDYPPYQVFDADGQDYVTGPLPTINAAEKLMSLLHTSSVMLGRPYQ